MRLVDEVGVMVERSVGRVLAVSPRISDRLPVRPPVRDSQQMNPRLHLLATTGKRDLLARRAPSAFTRGKFDWLMRAASAVRTGPVRTSDWAIPTSAGPLAARLYKPENGVLPQSLLVFVHGGGWHVGSVSGYDNTLRFLADRAGISILSADYRLAPEHPFPAAFDDVSATFRYAVDHADEWGVDAARIGIGGDSAGGNLAAAVALTADAGYRPAAVTLLYPALDWDLDRYESTTMFTVPIDENCIRRAMRWYAPTSHEQADPRFSVLAATDLSLMPRTYVATAGMDVLRDQGDALITRLRSSGVDAELRRFDNMPHGFASMLVDRDAQAATEEYARAVSSILDVVSPPTSR
ncbi:alpha/beta hydrolase [Nocardia salmonicida]|uniref:alpha/beta hydrolase n=1 Tax=Nocardia salmonicida TaxID=53431 RepID=UPI000A06A96D|nr:alpha/beta hydrolase [Nocardia salmonicida]